MKEKSHLLQGLENGIDDFHNNSEAGETQLWHKIQDTTESNLYRRQSFGREDADIETINQLRPIPYAKA